MFCRYLPDDKDVREKTLDDDPLYISMTGANKQKPNYENVPLAPNPLPSPSKPRESIDLLLASN